jgi:hypothetical protein
LIDGDHFETKTLEFCNANCKQSIIEYCTCTPHPVRKIAANNQSPENCQIKVVYLNKYTRPHKETVDKFIGMRIQKAINDGQTKFAVISNDEDFADIFGMLSLLNPDVNLECKLIKTNIGFDVKSKKHEIPTLLFTK